MRLNNLNSEFRALFIFERQFPNLFNDLQNVRCMDAIVRGLAGVHRKDLMAALKIVENLLQQSMGNGTDISQSSHQLSDDELGGQSIGGNSGDISLKCRNLIGHVGPPISTESRSVAPDSGPVESGAA